MPEFPVAQRPHRRPFHLVVDVDGIGHRVLMVVHRLMTRGELCVAEKLDVVGKDRVAVGEISEALRNPDLVALENAGIALDRFHQRTGFRLLGGRTLAEAAAAEARAQLIDIPGRRRKIMLGKEVGVERQLAFHLLELADYAGERRYMLAVALLRRTRSLRAVTAAAYVQPLAC